MGRGTFMVNWWVVWTKVVWGIPEEWNEWYALNSVLKLKMLNILLFEKALEIGKRKTWKLQLSKSASEK